MDIMAITLTLIYGAALHAKTIKMNHKAFGFFYFKILTFFSHGEGGWG
jgi:hypothetical protein